MAIQSTKRGSRAGGCSRKSTTPDEKFQDRIHPETRHAFDEANEVLAEAKQIRDSVMPTEEELLRWGARVKSEQPIGTAWAEMLEEAQALVARTSLKLVEDLERQREALGLFRAAHAALRSRSALSRLGLPKPALSSLAMSEKLRSEAVDATQLALEQSERILQHEAKQGPLDLHPVLASRRRLFTDAETMLIAARAAEEEAFQAADGGVSRDQWRVRELEEEVTRLRGEKRAFERRIKYLEEARIELAKARDEALSMIAHERGEKPQPVDEPTDAEDSGNDRLRLRLAPSARHRPRG